MQCGEQDCRDSECEVSSIHCELLQFDHWLHKLMDGVPRLTWRCQKSCVLAASPAETTKYGCGQTEKDWQPVWKGAWHANFYIPNWWKRIDVHVVWLGQVNLVWKWPLSRGHCPSEAGRPRGGQHRGSNHGSPLVPRTHPIGILSVSKQTSRARWWRSPTQCCCGWIFTLILESWGFDFQPGQNKDDQKTDPPKTAIAARGSLRGRWVKCRGQI